MENKRINVLFCLVLLFFIALSFILIRGFNARRANDINDLILISQRIKLKNVQIRMLYNQLVIARKENATLKTALQETKNDLDALSKRLGPSSAPAAAK
jgi:5-bromo-4-chloroindolyl phosphate hydrolysis protein